MKLLGLEIKVHMTVKVKVTLLVPASPGPGPSGVKVAEFPKLALIHGILLSLLI